MSNIQITQGGEGFEEGPVWRPQGGGQGKVFVLNLFFTFSRARSHTCFALDYPVSIIGVPFTHSLFLTQGWLLCLD